MARLFVTGINLNKNELQNARIQNLSTAPSSPVAGQIYFDTSTNVLYFYNGTDWIPASGSTEVIQDVIGSSIIGGTGLTSTYNDSSGETTIDLDNTAVSHGSYGGSASKTVSFTVDQQGRLTAASDTNISITSSQVSDITETIQDTIGSSLGEGEGIDIQYNDGSGITVISAEEASDTNKGVASFNATDFTVTSGNVTLNEERVSDIVGSMVTGNTETGITVTYQDSDNTLDFAVADQFTSHTTSDLAEGTNLYYTAERVQDEISTTVVAGTGLDSTYNDGAGTFTIDIDSTVTTNSGSQTLTNKTLGSGTTLSANLDAATYKITNLGTPTASGDAVNKSYVDGLTSGLDWKQSVNLLYDDSTPTLSGDSVTTPLEIDGHTALDTPNIGYRILVTNGNDAGIYVYNQTGTAWTLDRSADADTYSELIGAAVFVMEGTTYGSTSWVQSNHYITNFTGQTWTQFSGAGTYLAGAGLTLLGNTFSVDVTPTSGNASLTNTGGATEVKTDTSRGLSVDANGLGINAGTGLTFNSGALVFASGYGVRKHSQNIGDNSATSFTVTHNFGTKDVTIQVYEVSSPYAQVEADVKHTTSSAVTIEFASAPTTDQYRVVVVG
jgi:hypothetical protein